MKKVLTLIATFIFAINMFAYKIGFEERLTNKTGVITREIPTASSIKVEVDFESYQGLATFKILDSKKNVILTISSTNYHDFESILNLNSNEKYTLQIDFKDFTGEYDYEIKTLR